MENPGRRDPYFALCPVTEMVHPAILAHAHTEFARTWHLEKPENDNYVKELPTYRIDGKKYKGTGLCSYLQEHYYPKFKQSAPRRRTREVASSMELGEAVHRCMLYHVLGTHPPGTRAGLPRDMGHHAWHHITHELGHTPQVAELPVLIGGKIGGRTTRADLITKAPNGELWLWELKTGTPFGYFSRMVQYFDGGTELAGVRCDHQAQYHVQLHYTCAALRAAGIPIAQSRVIRVFQREGQPIDHHVTAPPEWTARLDVRNAERRAAAWGQPVVKKRRVCQSPSAASTSGEESM